MTGGAFSRNPPVEGDNLVSLYYAAVVLLEEVMYCNYRLFAL